MRILSNFVRTETSTNSIGQEYLWFVCKCAKCGNEYRVNNIAGQKNVYCSDCLKILSKERSEEIAANHKEKAYKAVKRDLKRLIDNISKSGTMQIDGKCYIKRSDVIEAINNYFSK